MTHRILIGADEAGYGPNLGPLLIAASVWSVPEEMDNAAFSAALQPTFRSQPWTCGCNHIPLGDSKQLFQPTAGLKSLEAGLMAMMHQIDAAKGPNLFKNLKNFHQFVQWPDPSQTSASQPPAPWYEQLEQLPVPSCLEAIEIQRLGELASHALKSHSIELLGVRATVITESQFNASVAESGSKGQLLSSSTLDLLGSFLVDEDHAVEVFCDRQGGRKNYLPVLFEAFPNEWFIETGQSTKRCSYRNTALPPRVFHFTVGGDSFAPTALASMLAKYLRERLMQSLNKFWKRQLPGLRPTAGYPLDAKRFRQEIEPTAKILEIPESMWWRIR